MQIEPGHIHVAKDLAAPVSHWALRSTYVWVMVMTVASFIYWIEVRKLKRQGFDLEAFVAQRGDNVVNPVFGPEGRYCLWGSNVDFGPGDPSIEIDYIAGYAGGDAAEKKFMECCWSLWKANGAELVDSFVEAAFNTLPAKSRTVLFQRMLTIVYVAQQSEIKDVIKPVSN